MVKIIGVVAVFIVLGTVYILYQQHQNRQQVAAILTEAKSSLQQVEQNPYYQRQPIETRTLAVEGE
jgi:hypothetical protein